MTNIADFSKEDRMEQFKASVDFLSELCEQVTPVSHADDLLTCLFIFNANQSILMKFFVQEKEVRFANWSHQAIEFLLGNGKWMSIASWFLLKCLSMKLNLYGNQIAHSVILDAFIFKFLIFGLGLNEKRLVEIL